MNDLASDRLPIEPCFECSKLRAELAALRRAVAPTAYNQSARYFVSVATAARESCVKIRLMDLSASQRGMPK